MPTATASAGKNVASSKTQGVLCKPSHGHRAARAPSHSKQSSASGTPRTGCDEVHVGTAVSKNPATAAATKPNSISCACHRASAKPSAGGAAPPASVATNADNAIAAHAAPSKKNGRKPYENNALRLG